MSGPVAAGDFTAEQLEIINLPVDAHALVSAAAGTGKTHALAGRLTRLIEGEGLGAGDDVLVLSFSRAAVAELRRRIGGLAGDARYVGVATFDSFATRILAAAEPDGPWRSPGLRRAGSAPRSTSCPDTGHPMKWSSSGTSS